MSQHIRVHCPKGRGRKSFPVVQLGDSISPVSGCRAVLMLSAVNTETDWSHMPNASSGCDWE